MAYDLYPDFLIMASANKIKKVKGIFRFKKSNFKKPVIHFTSVIKMDKTPSNDDINEKDFIEVVYQGKPMWALFKCPCTCGFTISLSLQKAHDYQWRVSINKKGRPDLYPSVWQKGGCHSHFWITDGRVIWCKNTGLNESNPSDDV